MSAPQLENGYLRVANELFDALLMHPFTKRQLVVMLALVRKTYGYNRVEVRLTVQELADITCLDRANVSRALSELEASRCVSIRHGKQRKSLKILKDYRRWMPCQNGTTPKTVPKRHGTEFEPCQNGTAERAKLARTSPYRKEKDKEKDIDPRYVVVDADAYIARAREALPVAAEPLPERDEEDVVFSLPSKDRGEVPIPAVKLAEWGEVWPDLDVAAELMSARQWLRDNPSKSKTARGLSAFVGNWLRRSDERRKVNGAQCAQKRMSAVERVVRATGVILPGDPPEWSQ